MNNEKTDKTFYIRLKDIQNIVPKRLVHVLEKEGVFTVGDLDSLDMEEFNRYREVDETLKGYLEQLKHKIATRPDEIRAATNTEKIVLPDEEEDDLKFMKSFTKVLLIKNAEKEILQIEHKNKDLDK